MNINELFDDLKTNIFFDKINGEIQLIDNEIIWTYYLDMDEPETTSIHGEDDDYCFDIIPSTEEKLNQAYNNDIETIQEIIDDVNDIINWTFTDPEIIDDKIIFKIY